MVLKEAYENYKRTHLFFFVKKEFKTFEKFKIFFENADTQIYRN
jgi:hypothetical protein